MAAPKVGCQIKVQWPIGKNKKGKPSFSEATATIVSRKDCKAKEKGGLSTAYKYLLLWDDGDAPCWSRLLHLDFKVIAKPRSSSSTSKATAKSPIANVGKKNSQISSALPWSCEEGDHLETPLRAYEHIADWLDALCSVLGIQSRRELRVYDPYFCNGSVKRHLASLGFTNVYNQKEDFYTAIEEKRIPEFDVLITNPPFGVEHMEKIFEFCESGQCGKPYFLLLPNSVYSRPTLKHFFLPQGPQQEGSGEVKEASKKDRKKARKKDKSSRKRKRDSEGAEGAERAENATGLASPVWFASHSKRYKFKSPRILRPHLSNQDRRYTSPTYTFWHIGLPAAVRPAMLKWAVKVKKASAAVKSTSKPVDISFNPASLPDYLQAGDKSSPLALFRTFFNEFCRTHTFIPGNPVPVPLDSAKLKKHKAKKCGAGFFAPPTDPANLPPGPLGRLCVEYALFGQCKHLSTVHAAPAAPAAPAHGRKEEKDAFFGPVFSNSPFTHRKRWSKPLAFSILKEAAANGTPAPAQWALRVIEVLKAQQERKKRQASSLGNKK